jgi:hypothetical protein
MPKDLSNAFEGLVDTSNEGSMTPDIPASNSSSTVQSWAHNLLEGYLQEVCRLLLLQSSLIYRTHLCHVIPCDTTPYCRVYLSTSGVPEGREWNCLIL